VNRVKDDETPYSHRDAPFIINIISMWSDTMKNEENIKWARDLWNAVQPFATGGVYVNFLMTEGADRIMAAYGKKKYERLVALKNKYDPTNFFSLNQNIKPANDMTRTIRREKLTTQSVFQSVTDRNGMLQSGMEEGVNYSFSRLDELLEKMQR